MSSTPLRSGLLLHAFILALLAVSPFTGTSLAAQDSASRLLVAGNLDDAPRPHWSAVRATASIDIDGRIDEGVWATAPVIDRFVQQQPNRGAPATERTEVRILYDDQNLYVAANLIYEDPSKIVRTGLLRDANTAQGDAFAILPRHVSRQKDRSRLLHQRRWGLARRPDR